MILKDFSVKICDFGLARTCPLEEEDGHLEVPTEKDERKSLGRSLYESRFTRRQ